ncbi:MAG: 23S rRNA (adenine(2503)-C(2))-methyltransferase RlmN [Desulfobacteraceae bacterium]
MHDILEFSRPELSAWFENNSIKPFRAKQIFKWIYIRNADGFENMTDIGKDLRATLSRTFIIPRLALEKSEKSADGTQKFLFRLSDGNHIESVLIPEKDHFTLCISSQVGCAQNCSFCLTAKGGFKRNLSASEIISQIRDVRQILSCRNRDHLLSNIVFMGMGEPLANYDNVVKAIHIITDTDFGLKFSPRRVTVSTAGIVPRMKDLGRDTTVNLAVSLNATEDKTRSMLMPVNRTYRIKDLLEACLEYEMKPRNKITFEYILIKGVNDTREDALRLVRMIAPIKAKVNLIAFNENDKTEYRSPSPDEVSTFLQVLLDRNVTAITRKSKGRDISAACGQLKAKLGE